MFDIIPSRSNETCLASPRSPALSLLARSGARLRLIASRRGGRAGLALICAFCDMIADPTVDPLHWPIDHVIALVRGPVAGQDAEWDRLVRRLQRIRDLIGDDLEDRDA